jgi:uncharacterized protein
MRIVQVIIAASLLALITPPRDAAVAQLSTSDHNADPSKDFAAAYERGDYAEVLRIVLPRAEQGAPGAQAFLAGMYFNGLGVAVDHARAAKWYRRAAEQGHVEAQFRLGAHYRLGDGVPQDFREAAVWYRRAAEKGNVFAQSMLAQLYAEGQGVPKDYVSAYRWFIVAAANPVLEGELERKMAAESARSRDLLANLMTPAQIAEAQRSASAPSRPPIVNGPMAPTPQISRGTGFFVSEDGRVLTNAHVVENCRQTTVRTAGNAVSARIVARDTRNDLALLASGLGPIVVGKLRPSARLGEDVVVFGYPLSGLLASGGNVTTGNVAALAGIGDDSRFLQISAPVQPGNSGGPVLDRQGSVVGIVVAKLDALKLAVATKDIPQNVNFAIKSATVVSFLDAQSVAHSEGSDGVPLSTADLAERAKAFTVQIECRH